MLQALTYVHNNYACLQALVYTDLLTMHLHGKAAV